MAIQATILDYELNWENSWKAIASKINYQGVIDVRYKQQDFCSATASPPPTLIEPADLYTLSYCLCQFRKRRKQAEPYFNRLFSQIPQNAYCLFVDINYSDEYMWFDDLAQAHGLEFLPSDIGTSRGHCDDLQMSADEAALADSRLFGKMQRAPTMSPKISYRLCRKK